MIFAGGWPITEFLIWNISGENITYEIKYRNMNGRPLIYNVIDGKYNLSNDFNLRLKNQDVHLANNETVLPHVRNNFHEKQFYDMAFSDVDGGFGTSLIASYNRDELPAMEFFQTLVETLIVYDRNNNIILTLDGIIKNGFDRSIYQKNDFGDNEGLHYIIISQEKINNTGFEITHIASENLRIRDGQYSTSSILTILQRGEGVQVIAVGSYEYIKVDNLYGLDNYYLIKETDQLYFYGCWVQIKTSTGIIGWCFSYYLNPKNGA
jgi:hypothetical protein